MNRLAILFFGMYGLLLPARAAQSFISYTADAPQSTAINVPYAETEEFPPIKIAQQDLGNILYRVHRRLSKSDMGPDHQERFEIHYYNPFGAVVGPGYNFGDDVNVPHDFYKFAYFFSNPSGEITRIQLILNDRHRKLVVEGTNPKKVQLITKTFQEGFTGHTYRGGGATFRLYGKIVIAALLTCAIWFSARTISVGRQKILPAIVLLFSLMALILILILPGQKILPGFTAYLDDDPYRKESSQR